MTSSRLIPLIIASALFMENMDGTIIATALPAIARDLGTDAIVLKLAFTTYLLSLTVFIPVSGWLADRFGARHVFRVAVAIFTLGSIACGLSTTLGELVAARGLQGIGGAMMVPVGRLILLRSVPKSELVDALAWLTIPALMGPLFGPPVGGFITDTFGWRYIFWMNLPFGILAILLASLYMPDARVDRVPPLDVKGFFLSAALALPLGLLIGAFRPVEALLEPLTDFIRYMPAVAFIPLVMLWFGIEESAKIAIIFIGTFFQMVLMVAENVRLVPTAQIEAAQTMGATRGEIIRLVLLQSAKPAILDTMRITMGWAWTYLVVAELVASNSGLGYAILRAQRFLKTDTIFGGILLIGLIGLLMDQAFRWLHRRAFPYMHFKR